MKKALISPNELIKTENNIVGMRIAQIADAAFDVAEPLFWVDCPDNYVADNCVYANDEIIYNSPIILDTK